MGALDRCRSRAGADPALLFVHMTGGDDDQAVIKQCLRAAVDGPFFPDWEFHTLFGFQREELRQIADNWPNWEDAEEQRDAVNATLNNLLGYPHNQWTVWHKYISPVAAEVAEVYARWRGDDTLDSSPRGYFDRLT